MTRKRVIILGSTGSIGRATLDVIEARKEDFEVFGLACRENLHLLKEQIERFKPRFVCLYDRSMRNRLSFDRKRLLTGMEGIREMVGTDGDMVVNALPGSIGLEPTIETLEKGKVLALANKESLVMGGRLIARLVREKGLRLIPVDSEHSALYQLLKTVPREELKSVTITASGGPFRRFSRKAMARVKPEEALNHPTWKMGRKVTLDSASLMNKGLEVIEARWLFDLEPSRIKVVVHPESIVHGMLELVDGSTIAYMSSPDMRLPIAYALSEEERHPLPFPRLELEKRQKLTFFPPDLRRFPSLRLAFRALETGDSAQIAMNTANEVASSAFVEGRIRFTDIPLVIEEVLDLHPVQPEVHSTETIWQIHEWAQKTAEGIIGRYHV